MFSSVKVGRERTCGRNAFFCCREIIPWWVSRSTARCCARPRQRPADSPGLSQIPVFQGRKGHPVLMSSRLIDPILQAPESSTLRDVIQRVGFETVEVADEGIVLDVDDPESYEAVRRAYERQHQ